MHSIRIPPALRTGPRLTILLAQNVRSKKMATATKPTTKVVKAPNGANKSVQRTKINAEDIVLSPLSDDSDGAPYKFFVGGWCFITGSDDTEAIAAAINNGQHYKSFTINADGEKVYKNSFRVLWDGASQDLSILKASGEVKSNRLQLSVAAQMSDEELADYYAED